MDQEHTAQRWQVSIHTPTKGVTQCWYLTELALRFQSTHPRRVWLIAYLYYSYEYKFQSTHPRRVWLEIQAVAQNEHEFQSTHPRRVWRKLPLGHLAWRQFQSTHPRRVWLEKRKNIFLKDCFNPHTHEGCDIIDIKINVLQKVSIHTPTKGVTKDIRTIIKHSIVSIHTPTKGVTLSAHDWHYTRQCFNPHTHEGCDHMHNNRLLYHHVSIHTPTKGVTSKRTREVAACFVSIHTPTKGVTF